MRDGFLSWVSSNVSAKIVSVAIAIVLWFIVLGSRNVEVTKEVPLEVITPSELVPANEIPEKIAFRLSGPKAFLRAILDRREDPIRVNLSGAKPGLVTYRFFSDNIHVPIGVKVLSINPTAILIKLEPLKRREIPVKVEMRGIPPEGYKVTRSEIRPATVRLKGAESRVDSISEIPMIPIDVSEFRQGMEREVSLELSRYGVQLDGPLPRVKIDVEPASANYRIKNVDIRVLTTYKYKLDEKSVSVFVRASPQDLRSLDRSRVYAVVDLRGKKRGSHSVPVKITLPENIGLVRVLPEKVNVTLH